MSATDRITTLAAMSGSHRLGALATIAAATALFSGCGGSDDGTIAGSAATELNSELTAAQTACAQGDAAGVRTHARAFLSLVENLPDTAGADLKGALRDGGHDLESLANPDDCPLPRVGTSDLSNTPPPTTSTSTETSTSTSTTSTTTKSNPSTGGQPPGQNDGGSGGTGTGKR
jgi:hypothetical protein